MDEVPSSENWKKTLFPQNDEMLHGIQQEEVQSPALGKEEPHAPGTCWKADQLESSFAGKDLGVPVGSTEHEPTMCPHCNKQQQLLGLH